MKLQLSSFEQVSNLEENRRRVQITWQLTMSVGSLPVSEQRSFPKAVGVALASRRSCQSELEHGDTTARELPSSTSSRPPMRSRCLFPSCLSRAAHPFTST